MSALEELRREVNTIGTSTTELLELIDREYEAVVSDQWLELEGMDLESRNVLRRIEAQLVRESVQRDAVSRELGCEAPLSLREIASRVGDTALEVEVELREAKLREYQRRALTVAEIVNAAIPAVSELRAYEESLDPGRDRTRGRHVSERV